MTGKEAVLIATLGTEPQVLTLCLQELLARGEAVTEAVGVHSSSKEPAIKAAVERLKEAWPMLPFGEKTRLNLEEVPIFDLDSERALVLLYRALKDLVANYRSRGFRVHLNISGGRKPMGICALLVAQLLFGPGDRLWYLLSSPELVESRALLAEPSTYKLLEIPVPLWTEATAFFQVLAQYEDPWAAVELQRRVRHQEEAERWQHFLSHVLTPAERKVVEELVHYGAPNKKIAQRLNVSPRTVEHQLASVYEKLHRFLGYPPGFVVNRATVVAILAPFLRGFPPEKVGRSADEKGRQCAYD